MEMKKVFMVTNLIKEGQRSDRGGRREAHNMALQATILSNSAATTPMAMTNADSKDDPCATEMAITRE